MFPARDSQTRDSVLATRDSPLPPATTITDLIQRAARAAGFDVAGVAPVGDFRELQYFPGWLAQGYGGEMGYLEARNPAGELKRASLQAVAPWARSVVVCAINYNTAHPSSLDGPQAPAGWISRYAWSAEDYHQSVMRRLRQVEARIREHQPGCQTRCYVDTGPLVERVFAKYAGVGWIAKNTCLINQRLGSWLFLGVILTSLQFEAGLPAPDRCGSCTRCLDACPTNAFPAPYQLDATRCISYLTIEKRGEIPEDLRPGIGRHVFGCDICQDVCPWNRQAPATPLPEFQPRPGLVNPPLARLATLDEEQFRREFRGSAVRRTKFSGLRRNLAVAMGNSGDPGFKQVLERLAVDPDPVVASHARWALERLGDAG
jgi:epoxyqueuosine reductase